MIDLKSLETALTEIAYKSEDELSFADIWLIKNAEAVKKLASVQECSHGSTRTYLDGDFIKKDCLSCGARLLNKEIK